MKEQVQHTEGATVTVSGDLESAGWLPLGIRSHQRFFRWENGKRVELDVGFDRAGRLVVWSEWHNERVSIDHDKGRRARLIKRATQA